MMPPEGLNALWPLTLILSLPVLTLNRSENQACEAGIQKRQSEIFRLLIQASQPKALTSKAVWNLGYYSAVETFYSELRLFGVLKWTFKNYLRKAMGPEYDFIQGQGKAQLTEPFKVSIREIKLFSAVHYCVPLRQPTLHR